MTYFFFCSNYSTKRTKNKQTKYQDFLTEGTADTTTSSFDRFATTGAGRCLSRLYSSSLYIALICLLFPITSTLYDSNDSLDASLTFPPPLFGQLFFLEHFPPNKRLYCTAFNCIDHSLQVNPVLVGHLLSAAPPNLVLQPSPTTLVVCCDCRSFVTPSLLDTLFFIPFIIQILVSSPPSLSTKKKKKTKLFSCSERNYFSVGLGLQNDQCARRYLVVLCSTIVIKDMHFPHPSPSYTHFFFLTWSYKD